MPPEKPLLIIECDSRKLEAQGLSCAARLGRHARLTGKAPTIVRASTTADLANQLALACAVSVFDAVVVVAHGNERGLVLGSDDDLTGWTTVAEWLQPLEPVRIGLVACQAARTIAATELFESIESLDEVFASPLVMTRAQSYVIDALLPALMDPDVSEDYVRLVQASSFILSEGLLFRYTREHHDEGDDVSDVFATMFESTVVPELARVLSVKYISTSTTTTLRHRVDSFEGS